MRTITVVRRSLVHYWRTHLAVVWGAATAVAVLAGALLVGESVRASLRDLFVARLGETDLVISAHLYFREELADELQAHPRFARTFRAACPMIVMEGLVTHEADGRRASGVSVYGVDERFWDFHGWGQVAELGPRDVLLTERLAQELGSAPGDSLLVTVGRPTDVPATSLHGRKTNIGRTIRLTSRQSTPDFALYPGQDSVLAVFVPLERLQRDLEQEAKVNTILLSETDSAGEGDAEAEILLRDSFELEDLGVKLRWLESRRSISAESEAVLLSEALSQAVTRAAEAIGWPSAPILTYLANSIGTDRSEIPYSLVSALPAEDLADLLGSGEVPSTDSPIFLNGWAARDLGVRQGDRLTMEYYVWEDEGRLVTRTAEFRLGGIVPLEGRAADPDLAPLYPGITDSDRLTDWEPPFPVDLGRIRPQDEDYWERYRTTPKAFVPLARGQELWGNRYGDLTSIRIHPVGDADSSSAIDSYGARLRDELDPLEVGFSVYAAREQGLQASRGATDFGQYFVYFSFFLVVSALLLTALFFKLGVEQRLQEVGLLRAVGFSPRQIRGLFLREGMVLAAVGAIVGVAGALAYAGLIMLGLTTWWVDAVGTRLLTLHVSPVWLVLGGLGGTVVASLSIAWTLVGLQARTPRALLAGSQVENGRAADHGRGVLIAGIATLAASAVLVIGSLSGWLGQVAGFFGAGSLLLTACLCHAWARLAGTKMKLLSGAGTRAVVRLGFRNATYRPGRSLLSVALIAFAAFVIVSVDAFRRDAGDFVLDRHSGNGGFLLLAESVLPVNWDPNSAEGRVELGLDDPALKSVRFASFRVRPGDDTSCLNLYQPRNPRIIAPSAGFIEAGRFAFQASLAETAGEEGNPWLLLTRETEDGAVPVIGDANSMTYVVHLGLGEDLPVPRRGGEAVRLRLVGTLADSIFQDALVMSEENFHRLFPDQDGFRFFLLDAAPAEAEAVTETLERNLSDFGLDVTTSEERLAEFHRVENTYLSTFQTLGGLGLVLGTLGLAAVLLRNVMERRGELALLRAFGYGRGHFTVMVLAENALLVLWGVLIGTVCALVAITPALQSHGGGLSYHSLLLLLLAVPASGLAASVLAVAATLRSPLLPALRTE